MSDRPDRLVRNIGVISALTMLSRMLGLARDCLCAAVFGAGWVWDAFSFAFRIPNLFRRLFGEGALSAAFIPIFSERLELGGRDEAQRMICRVAGAMLVVLGALLAAGEALVLALLRLTDLGDTWRLALGLTAVMLPYMLLICLTALAGAALNSLRHFGAPAAAPIILNVCWIAAVALAALIVPADPPTRVFVLAVAIVTAGVLQLGLQAAVLKARGFHCRPAFEMRHPEVRRVAAAMAPVALGMAAFQLNVLLDGVVAISLAGPPGGGTFELLGASVRYPMAMGANSVLYYAGRLMQLPLGVFGIAVATAAFPLLSRHAARQDWRAFADSLRRGLGLVLFIGLPAGVGLIVLRRPIIELVFERGAFTPAMTARTAAALAAYSTAMWAYCALHVLTRAFYARHERATPAKVAAVMVGANLALNLTLVWPLAESGLAASTAVCAALQVAILYGLLGRRMRLEGGSALLGTAAKTAAATACMAAACRLCLAALPEAAGAALGVKLLRALAPAAAGSAAFVVAAAALRVQELDDILRRLLPSRRLH